MWTKVKLTKTAWLLLLMQMSMIVDVLNYMASWILTFRYVAIWLYNGWCHSKAIFKNGWVHSYNKISFLGRHFWWKGHLLVDHIWEGATCHVMSKHCTVDKFTCFCLGIMIVDRNEHWPCPFFCMFLLKTYEWRAWLMQVSKIFAWFNLQWHIF